MKPEDRKRLKQHIDLIVEHKLPKLSGIREIMQALRLAKEAQVGVTLDYFSVIELLGHINALEEDDALATHELAAYQSRIREMEKQPSKSDVSTSDISTTENVLIDIKTVDALRAEVEALNKTIERYQGLMQNHIVGKCSHCNYTANWPVCTKCGTPYPENAALEAK